MIAAVIDTNVVLAARRSKNPRSPNLELIAFWKEGAFAWLITPDILEEYIEKLLALGAMTLETEELISSLIGGGVNVPIKFFHLRHYPDDPDDTAFILAALNGSASHLVSYDDHLHTVSVFYPEFITCEPVEFLRYLRG